MCNAKTEQQNWQILVSKLARSKNWRPSSTLMTVVYAKSMQTFVDMELWIPESASGGLKFSMVTRYVNVGQKNRSVIWDCEQILNLIIAFMLLGRKFIRSHFFNKHIHISVKLKLRLLDFVVSFQQRLVFQFCLWRGCKYTNWMSCSDGCYVPFLAGFKLAMRRGEITLDCHLCVYDPCARAHTVWPANTILFHFAVALQ